LLNTELIFYCWPEHRCFTECRGGCRLCNCCLVLRIVCFVSFNELFVCKCVLYFCYWV